MMTKNSAPEEILEFTACGCKNSACSSNRCQCFAVNMKCVGLCNCPNCTNLNEEVKSEDEVLSSNENESSENTGSDMESE